MNNITANTKNAKDIPAFFVWTFLISLPIYIIVALIPQEMAMMIGPILLVPAPITAALILTLKENQWDGAKSLLKRSLDYKSITRKIWFLPILLLMPVIFALASGAMILMGEPLPASMFPAVAAPVAFIAFFFMALFEEVGWMGYVFDSMQDRWNALAASIVLGILWAAWHLPLYIHLAPPLWIAMQLISLVAIRTLIVWIYNNTEKSVFAAILIHTVYNVCTLMIASFSTSLGHLITCIFTIITAVIVAFLWDPETLTQYRFRKK